MRSDARRFHLLMAGVFVLIAFGGFIPSYWLRLAGGNYHPPPITHIHGILQFSWTLFYLLQTAWVATGRTPRHRAWGLAGISLFSVLICSIIILKITNIRLDDARGFGDASRRFSAVTFCALPVMIGLFALAIANVRKPDIHKRLMYVLMTGLMIPAIARVFLAVLAPPGDPGWWPSAGLGIDPAGLRGLSADRRGHAVRLAHTRAAAPGLCLRRSGRDGCQRRGSIDCGYCGVDECGEISAESGGLSSRRGWRIDVSKVGIGALIVAGVMASLAPLCLLRADESLPQAWRRPRWLRNPMVVRNVSGRWWAW